MFEYVLLLPQLTPFSRYQFAILSSSDTPFKYYTIEGTIEGSVGFEHTQ